MNASRFRYRAPASLLVSLGALLALVACRPEGGVGRAADGAVTLDVPPPLRVRAVDPLNLLPRVRVNGVPVVSIRTNDQWTVRTTVPEGEPLSISITWIERIGQDRATRVDLRLARLEGNIGTIDSDRTFLFTADDYETDVFDDDGDDISNLAERIGDTDPFSELDPGDDVAQVLIPRIAPADAPVVDGAYDAVWDRAQYRDRDDDELLIDNLMVNDGAVLLDGATGYRWGAMHDGEAMYLIVFAEAGTGQTPFGDSADAFEDDSVDVYFDADNSRGTMYDGVDDRHLILPLLDANGGSNASDGADARLDFGPNTAPFARESIDYATCRCDGDEPGDVQVYELRLSLDTFELLIDEAFGFEVQINDDRDGDGRDVKWGWFHPSRVNEDVDETYRDPSYLGTARLLP